MCRSLVLDNNRDLNAYEIFNLGDYVCFREHDSAQLTCERKGAENQNVYIFTISPGSLRQEELDAIERELKKAIAHEASLSSAAVQQSDADEDLKRLQVPGEQRFQGSVLDISIDQSGQRSIKFKFSQFLPNEIDPAKAINKHLFAEELLTQFISETTVEYLPFSVDYIRVVKKIISMSMGDPVSLDKGDDIILTDLAYKIELRKQSMPEGQAIDKELDGEDFYTQLGLVDNDGSCCWAPRWSDFIEYFSRIMNAQDR